MPPPEQSSNFCRRHYLRFLVNLSCHCGSSCSPGEQLFPLRSLLLLSVHSPLQPSNWCSDRIDIFWYLLHFPILHNCRDLSRETHLFHASLLEGLSRRTCIRHTLSMSALSFCKEACWLAGRCVLKWVLGVETGRYKASEFEILLRCWRPELEYLIQWPDKGEREASVTSAVSHFSRLWFKRRISRRAWVCNVDKSLMSFQFLLDFKFRDLFFWYTLPTIPANTNTTPIHCWGNRGVPLQNTDSRMLRNFLVVVTNTVTTLPWDLIIQKINSCPTAPHRQNWMMYSLNLS